jgi:peptidoglycan/xylan/chitin deacetylase (PgdA/CDA1 family)
MLPGAAKHLLSFVPAHPAFTALTRIIFGRVGAILMFHEVQENPDDELRTGCSPAFLDRLIRGLLARGWQIVSLDEALRRIRNGTERRFVVLTFDDGYRDTLDCARVILERYSAPFTVYVPTGAVTRELNGWWLGLREIFRGRDVVRIDALQRTFSCPDLPSKVEALRQTSAWIASDFSVLPTLCDTFRKYHICIEELVDRYFLDGDSLKCLARNPLVTIGGHSSSHRALSTLSEREMDQELADNRTFLERLLDVEIGHLAYPYGTAQACGEREFAASSKLGFISAVTAEKHHLDQRRVRLHRLPRIDVTGARWADICARLDSAEPAPMPGPAVIRPAILTP